MLKNSTKALIVIVSPFLLSCSMNCGDMRPRGLQGSPKLQTVKASYYGKSDGLHGKKTASGEVFNCQAFTAAHRTLKFGTRVKLINPANQRFVEVRINDRGPFSKGRDIDVSYAAAKALGITQKGVANLKIEVLA